MRSWTAQLQKVIFRRNLHTQAQPTYLPSCVLRLVVKGGIMSKQAIRIALLVTFSAVWCMSNSLFLVAAERTGMVTGTVTDPAGAVIRGAQVTLRASRDFGRTILTDETGQFKFEHVPFSPFVLAVEARGFSPTEFASELHTSVLVHDVHFKSVSEVQHVEVKGQQDITGNRPSMTRYSLDGDDIERMPAAPANRALSAVVESVPGTVPEE